jgi:chromosome segregation ATPase
METASERVSFPVAVGMTTPRTPSRAVDAVSPTPESNLSLERGFVASLRWLVSEGDARGVRRIAVELRALREALATLDETRTARDEQVRRNTELDRELQSALAMLGPGTAVNGNGTLVQRLMKLRERLAADTATRQQLTLERDAWRAMCTLLTHTRASAQELLERAESERDASVSQLEVMQERVMELTVMHDDAAAQAQATRNEMAQLREQLRHWSGAVERALAELAHGVREIAD